MADYWIKVDYEPVEIVTSWNDPTLVLDYSPVSFMDEPIPKPSAYRETNPYYEYLNTQVAWAATEQGYLTSSEGAGSDPSIRCTTVDGTQLCYQLTTITYYAPTFSITESHIAEDFAPEQIVGDDQVYVMPPEYGKEPVSYSWADYQWLLVERDDFGELISRRGR